MARTITGMDNIRRFIEMNPDAAYQVSGGAQNFLNDPFLLESIKKQDQMYQQMLAEQQAAQGPGGILGFANNLGKALVDPFARLAQVGAVGATHLAQGGDAAGQMQKNFFGEDSNLLEEGLKGAAGVGAWFVPGMGATGSIMNLATRGAAAGALGNLSTQNFLRPGGLDVGGLATGALIGGGIGGGIGLGSKLLNKAAGKTVEQFDDVIARQREAILKAGGNQGDVAKLLGATDDLGQINARVNYLSGADDITKGVPRQLASGQGFTTTPAEASRLAGDILKRAKPGEIPGIGNTILGDLAGKADDAAFLTGRGGLSNSQIINAVKGVRGVTSQQADDVFRILGENASKAGDLTSKAAYSADDVIMAGRAAGLSDDILTKMNGKLGVVPAGSGGGTGIGQKLVDTANKNELGQIMRELGRPTKNLGSVGLYDDALKLTTPGGEPLVRLGDSADEVLRKSQEVLTQRGPVLSGTVDDMAQRGVTVDVAPIRENLTKMAQGKVTSEMKEPILKALGTLDEITPKAAPVNYADVYKVLQGTKGIGTKADAYVMAMQQRTAGAVGAGADDVAFMLRDMGVSDDIANQVSQRLGAGTSQVPIDQFYKFKQEIGPLTKSSMFSPVKEQTSASAYNKLYGQVSDKFDETLKANGFNQLRPLNKELEIANKLKQHLIGRVESGAATKPIGFGELVGGAGGMAMFSNPVGIVPGMAMSKALRSDAAQRAFIGGVRKLGEVLGGSATPGISTAASQGGNIASRTLGRAGGIGQNILRSPMVQRALSDQGTKIMTSALAPTGARMMNPDSLALNPGSILGIQQVSAAELPADQQAVEGEVMQPSVDPTTGLPITTQSGGFASSNYMTGGGMPNAGGMGGGGYAPQQGITMMELLDASLQVTGGDLGQAMQLAKFLAPEFGIGADGTSKANKDVQGLQLAEGLVNEAEELTGFLGLGDSPVIQKATAPIRKFASGIGLDTSYDEYRQQKEGLVARIARAMGETGPLTDVDIARYSMMLPDAGDTEAQAAEKIRRLRDRLQRGQSVYSGLGLGGGEEEQMYSEDMLSSAYY